jgi:hypothetical protein
MKLKSENLPALAVGSIKPHDKAEFLKNECYYLARMIFD